MGGTQIEGTALTPHVLQGKTFMSEYSDEVQTGIMPYQGTNVAALGVEGIGSSVYYYIPKGYYDEDGGGSCVYAPLDNFGNATVNDVLKGKTFTSSAGLKISGTYSPTRSFKHVYNTKIGCWGSGSYTLTEDYDFLIINVCAIRTGAAAQCNASYSGKGTATTYRATSWSDDGCFGLSRQILVTGVSKGDKVSFGNCAYSAQVNIVGINKS